MRAIERAARAMCPGDATTKDELWPEYAADARAAVLAFLDGVDAREIGYAAAAIRDNRDCDKTEAVIAALRAALGGKP